MAKTIPIEDRIELLAKRNGFVLQWRSLKFGFKRAEFECSSFGELNAIEGLLKNIKGVSTSHWICNVGGVFEGIVYVMSEKDKDLLDEKLLAEKNRIEDWWQRYHVADEETRRLMACGAIN